MDPSGECDWTAFAASALSTAQGAVTVSITLGADTLTSGGAALFTGGVLISGTASAIGGVAGMIGACTGMDTATLTQLAEMSPGAAVAIAIANPVAAAAGTTVNNDTAAAVGTIGLDLIVNGATVFSYIVNDGAQTLSDLASFVSAYLTAASDALTYCPTGCGADNPVVEYTPPVVVTDAPDPVPYVPSDVTSELNYDETYFY